MIKIVERLNEFVYNAEYLEGDLYFEYSTVGYVDTITFSGIVLWCSEDDPEENVYDFVLERYNELVDRMINIKKQIEYDKA